jgi:RES domain-containing protein
VRGVGLRWWTTGMVGCSFALGCALGVQGTAQAATGTEHQFCSAMTQVAKADAAVLTDPTAKDLHTLTSDLKEATATAPPSVATNRVQLANLISSNLLGQNTPAIAAVESQYVQMWAEDVASMFDDAGSSASVSVSTKLAPVATYVQQSCPSSGKPLAGVGAG